MHAALSGVGWCQGSVEDASRDKGHEIRACYKPSTAID